MPAPVALREERGHAEKALLHHATTRAYRIPTQGAEADGTLEWDATGLITVEIEANGVAGLGYSYAGRGCVAVIEDALFPALADKNLLDIPACWDCMCRCVRNLGRSGEVACALSAIDHALWDLKAAYLQVPLAVLLGMARASIPVYGSGGFINYTPRRIGEQIDFWRSMGITNFKIKIGRADREDSSRLAEASKFASGGNLFVDANGAYTVNEALEMAEKMAAWNVIWFEEPVSSDDLEGLRFVRAHAPTGMHIAAGEYGYTIDDFRSLLENRCVDSLQADATRCQGLTGFLKAAVLAEAYRRPLSSHCAPALHAAVMCHAASGIHMEYFWDHMIIENRLFDGVPAVKDGHIEPQMDRPGTGLVFKRRDAEAYVV